jgi:phosphatidylglycerophosphate synthase
VLVAALALVSPVGVPGWTAALVCAVGVAVYVRRGLPGPATGRFGPADRFTYARAALACALAAPAADAVAGRPHAPLLIAVPAAVALGCDLADGVVARRTGTASAFGARFDGESDAFLIAVLSVAAVPVFGWWVLALGAARYAFLLAGRLSPALRAPLPPRYWRKVVAAEVGITLVVAVSDVLPRGLALAGLVVAALLLAESFGRDVWWLWRHRASVGVPASLGW